MATTQLLHPSYDNSIIYWPKENYLLNVVHVYVLQFRELGSNQIQYVPDALKTSAVVPALVELGLDNNLITFLENDAFSGVNTLSVL